MAAGQYEDLDNLTASNSAILPDDSDHSILQQPLNVGVKNVKQILKCIQNGSPEIKDLILNECNIIYECKLCSNLFRSVANFLYHKRVYCKNHLCEDMLLFETLGNPGDSHADDQNFSAMKNQFIKTNDTELSVTDTSVSVSKHSETVFSQKSSEISSKYGGVGSQKCLPEKSQPHSTVADVIMKNDFQKGNICVSSEADKQELTEVDNLTLDVEMETEKKEQDKLETSNNLQTPVSSTSSFVVNVKKYNISDRASKNIFISKNLGSFLKSQSSASDVSETKNSKKSSIIPIVIEKIHENPNAVLQRPFIDASSIVSKEGLDICLVQNNTDMQEKLSGHEQKNTNDKSYDEDPNSITSQNNLPQKNIYMTRKRRLLGRNDCDLAELMCCICKLKFSTLKILYTHMMSSHSQVRLHYPCPFCKTLFVQMYGVTRHLVQIHGKKKEQVNKKLREIIRKKAVWKYVNDNEEVKTDEVKHGEFNQNVKYESEVDFINSGENDRNEKLFHPCVKVERSMMLHHCSKCNRVFSRKSSQVSHEKFCIMNSEKKEILSRHLSISSSKLHVLNDIKVNTRPKRAAEKQMHKDFVNSQTLKWRSANKIETVGRTSSIKWSRTHERKIMSVINVTKLLCLKCDKRFSSFSNLRRHAAIHIGWTRYKCTLCNSYKSYNRSDCKQHVQRAHSVSEEDLDQYVKSLLSEVKPGETSSIEKSKLAKNCLIENKTQNKLENSCKNVNIAHAKSLLSENFTAQFQSMKNDCNEKKNSEKKKPHKKTKKMPLKSNSSALFRTKSSSVNEHKKSVLDRKQSDKKKNMECKKQNICNKVDDEVFPCIDKLQMTYKSSTTSSPTTIILSKTCASSTVQIMKNAPVSFLNSLNSDKFKAITERPLQQIEVSKNVSSLCPNPSKAIPKIISCKTDITNYEDDESGPVISDAYSHVAKTLKESKRLKRPVIAAAPLMSRRDNAPLIIGLVPASSPTSSNMTS